MNPIRAAGSAGSIGRYAAPVLSTAKIATIASADRENSSATHCTRARPLAGQQVRQPVRGLLQLAVGHRAALAAHRHRLRGAGHLRGEQHRNRHRAGAGWVNTARLPHPSSRACSPASSRSIDDNRRVGSAVIATNTRCNRSISASMLSASNTSVSNSTRRPSSVARHGLQRQRVVGGFAAGELGDGQPVDARQRGGVDRVVLVHEKGVEQLVVAGDAVDLAERQVLVLEGVVVGALQLVEQVGGGGCRR